VLEVHFGGDLGYEVFWLSALWRVQFRETIAGQGNRLEAAGYLEGNGCASFIPPASGRNSEGKVNSPTQPKEG
jgi:hypothetical protein